MDSDEDRLDAFSVDSGIDYYSDDTAVDYIDGGDGDGDGDDDDDGGGDYDYYDDDSGNIMSSDQQKNYIALKDADIRQLQEEDIKNVATVLSISSVESSILLLHYHWSESKVHEAWFADEGGVRQTVGLLEPVVPLPNDKELTCGICLESCPRDLFSSTACGHPFCNSCWGGYIHTSIVDGTGCLTLRCPYPSCVAAVGQNMIEMLATDEDKQKYARYFLRSYVEENREIKWCPAPGCEHAVKFDVGSGACDVTCLCSYAFCWKCTEEAHRPVDCETVSKWITKSSAESENMIWILANSKPCPRCNRPIEKNEGCVHMICKPPCKHEFCWLCLGAWSEHGKSSGGFYACNKYEKAKQAGAYDETEKQREMAQNDLKRYAHYYERWAANQSSRKKALADLHHMQIVCLEKLSDIQARPESQLKCITEAWLQIVECRRVLQWTYAYGYYLPEHEKAKRQFFEYIQGDAEDGLERLHQCAEKDLLVYLHAKSPSKDFDYFRKELAELTRVTRNFFEKLVRELEEGLPDVDAQEGCSNAANSKVGATTKGKGAKGKGSSR